MVKGKGCMACKIVGLLVIFGAINWGLIGFLKFDLVETIFGAMTGPTRAIYGLIGLAGILKLVSLFKACPCGCNTKEKQ